MIISLLFSNPVLFLAWIIAVLMAISIHEYFHAWSAYILGDSTAKDAGRLTINPLAHIDWMGLLLLMIIGIGWGKPVPVNHYNLRKSPKYGPALVSLSGAAANLLLAVGLGILMRFALYFHIFPQNSLGFGFLDISIQINLILAVFNLMPIPPLDGSHILFTFLPQKYENIKLFLTQYSWALLIGIIIFGSSLIFGIVNFLYKLIVF